MVKTKEKKIGLDNVKDLAINGLFIALTFVATAFINLRLPIAANGGLVHLGNAALFIAAVLFGKRTGAIAGAFGMALFDLVSGWTLWAPFTFVIVGLMGYMVGLITEKKRSIVWEILGFVVALLIKIAGYYVAEGIIYGNWIAPVTSVPGNIVQVTVGAIISLPVIEALKKARFRNAI